jgi:hypothetical protein
MTRKLWPAEWVDYLIKNYPHKSNHEIAEYLGIPRESVLRKANRMGLLKAPIDTLGMTKNQRYRLKNVSQGLCPRCATPCAPFYLCERHREIDQKRAVKGKRRTFKPKARRKIFTKTGLVTKVGHITTHRMV